MVEWSDSERNTIASVWGKINVGEIGPQALARVLIVYPWTQRYFGSFGNLSSAAAILGNPKVSNHGKTVLNALEKAVKNLDGIKGTYSELSQLYCDKLNVDPDNFRLLADCLTIVVATAFGSAFSPATWQKFLSVVVSALSSRYF
ncbi:hemoglobin, beta adult 2 isoform X2 [Sinocyclocheilus anshuiensis]|uniref:Hemoglobin cathodic subunit beta-like n=1 Tax=Sinocyclocheilus anshuiensis TaxID=1608454 RepID=A0A671Q3L3_9TELE|nr:PREDICTED: hemoglobin cathodic subunit beta-like isoform X1 [Sinocyclocheilus anshuiensis]XP_016321146.1 PREDICTED: hemoglobin cathodic subunit beta-like isoform X2 [Sinocyclocheilus anshuiensis]